MKFQFPHFSHRISARLVFRLEMTLLWLGLAALVGINILSLQKSRPAYWNKLMMLFETPFSVNRHIDLASLLWKQGNKKEARQLIASAETGSVLGVTTDPKSVLVLWEKEAQARNKQYSFWQSISMQYHDYRDAYLMLALLAYQLGNHEEARGWIEKAQTIDPNSLPIVTLREYLR